MDEQIVIFKNEKTGDLIHSVSSIRQIISKNSKKQTVLVKSEIELANFLKKNLITDEIILGMGAGIISKWIRNLQYNL